MKNQIELFQSSDIKSSAYLISEGVSLVKLITSNNKKVIFCFPNTKEVKTFLQQYWTNRASVNPRLLFENFDYLKGLIYRDYEI